MRLKRPTLGSLSTREICTLAQALIVRKYGLFWERGEIDLGHPRFRAELVPLATSPKPGFPF